MKQIPSTHLKNLRTAVSNYNRALTKATKQGINPSLIPSRANVKQLISSASNLHNINSAIAQLKNLTKTKNPFALRTNSQGVQITNYQYAELRRQQNIVNKRIKRNREKIAKNLGFDLKTASYKQLQKVDDISGIRGIRFEFNSLTAKGLNVVKNMLNTRTQKDYYETRYDQLRENYIRAVREGFMQNDITDRIEALIQNATDAQLHIIATTEGLMIKDYYLPNLTRETLIEMYNQMATLTKSPLLDDNGNPEEGE